MTLTVDVAIRELVHAQCAAFAYHDRIAIDLHEQIDAFTPDEPVDLYVVIKAMRLTVVRRPGPTHLDGHAIVIDERLRGRALMSACAIEVGRYLGRMHDKHSHAAAKSIGASIAMPLHPFVQHAQRCGFDVGVLYTLYPYCTRNLITWRIAHLIGLRLMQPARVVPAQPHVPLAQTHVPLSTAVDF